MIAVPSILRLDPLRIDVGSAINGGINPRHGELALVVDGHLDDGRDVAYEAAVRREAQPAAVATGRPQPPISVTRSITPRSRPASIGCCRRAHRSSHLSVTEVRLRIVGAADDVEQRVLLDRGWSLARSRRSSAASRTPVGCSRPSETSRHGCARPLHVLALHVGDREHPARSNGVSVHRLGVEGRRELGATRRAATPSPCPSRPGPPRCAPPGRL